MTLNNQYFTFPQRPLFDRIGIRKMVLEADPYGNFIITGYDYGTARNWAPLDYCICRMAYGKATEYFLRVG